MSIPGGRWIALQSLIHMAEPTLSAPESLARAWSEAGFPLDGAADGDLRRERAFAKELLWGVLRWERRLDAVIKRMAKKGKMNPVVREIVRLGLYQLVFLDRIPARAACAETVALTRPAGVGFASGFVNGLLRRFTREQESLWKPRLNGLAGLAETYAYPQWFVERMYKVIGDRVEGLLKAGNEAPGLTLRVHGDPTEAQGQLAAVKAALAAEDIPVEGGALSPMALKLGRGVGQPNRLPGFEDGQITVQDEGAQLVALLLAPQSDWTVLDACAAPGGKTAHIAQFLDKPQQLWALEASGKRIHTLKNTLSRMGLDGVQVCHGALGQGATGWGTAPDGVLDGHALSALAFDAVVVDAPCSGWGIVHRHPEIKRRKGPKEIRRMAEGQQAILADAAGRVKPGGVLLYSVCSILPQEGPEVVSAFLATHSDFEMEDPRVDGSESQPWHRVIQEDGSLSTDIQSSDCDGFYAVRLRRKTAS